MNICIYIDPSQSRLWHKTLVERLKEDCGVESYITWAEPKPHPDYIETLLAFELRQHHNGAGIGAEPFPAAQLQDVTATVYEDIDYDLTVDLVGDGKAPAAKRSVTILYNGYAGEKALIASIMQSGLPQVAFRDATGDIVATAQPSPELAVGVIGSMDQVFARLITLLSAFLSNPNRWVQPLVKQDSNLPSAMTIALRTAKSQVMANLKKVYYQLCRASHWRVGWRWVDQDDVWSRHSLEGEEWQVLADEESHFYADPVPWLRNGRYYLFFEDLDHHTQQGIISVVEFDDKGKPGPTQTCLEEDYHLSYPFLLEHQGETYMIPETSENRDIALYKARNFPFGWERCHVIMSDIDAADVTITQHDDKWWIFCVIRDGAGGYSDCLSIFYADDLLGPWSPHAQNPVLIDTATARPAGNFVKQDGKLFRPVQDCTEFYGGGLNLVEVTKLTPERYEQKLLTKLGPNSHWPGCKLHTLNRVGRLETIDGAILRPKMPLLRRIVQRIRKPVGTL
ncbi:glucosamine inositolphosphorylceramide transferase family protein [Cohaesibacter celericrescens]|uniref:Glucosamine inositolphosphorylceramide transferase 1 N-terminal domain-containing protein n=1 Tax=Cohaesibacter celericrescens TaxID=2067669 RepID=A0A2N5XMX2_9HYPH|nr:hypothetical protein [Cohaesibacter celericrescens]PLW75879.1 hypothetical protein C0081_17400 [Cohaesibacter celericrescens]